jgi:hypothetical protein
MKWEEHGRRRSWLNGDIVPSRYPSGKAEEIHEKRREK